jgi:hypothetical protein
MSRVVVIEKNKDGKIELTKEELQKMLDDAYTQGYTDGKGRYETITYPSYPAWRYTTASTNLTSKDTVTLNGTDVSI